MRNLIRRLFGKKEHKPKNVMRLTSPEFDELVGVKLMGLRQFINNNLNSRDGDKMFDADLQDAFQLYEQTIKRDVKRKAGIALENDVVLVSPMGALESLAVAVNSHRSTKPKKGWRLRRIKRKVVGFYYKAKFTIQMYWQHILLMNEIRKLRKFFPGQTISNQNIANLINASKLNKRVMEKYPI